ncbi:hypothetical protein E2320_006269, partial [Naja naja]
GAEDKKGSADHPKASRLPRDVPGGHLLVEDAFSGSEDESDLGSVKRPLQLVLTPRDLCLGFVALASWAVKTSDLHSPDAWKI